MTRQINPGSGAARGFTTLIVAVIIAGWPLAVWHGAARWVAFGLWIAALGITGTVRLLANYAHVKPRPRRPTR